MHRHGMRTMPALREQSHQARVNHGAFKQRAPAHSDRPTNWYRKAPHDKQ